ncbi:MAG TPA: substrate-binding domain-containing protein [Vicinamibacteria bacterium]
MLRQATNALATLGRAWRVICVPLAILSTAPVAAQEANHTRVIVSSDNPVQEMDRPEVARIFLGQVSQWKDGTKMRPVDQSMTSIARKDFSSAVLKRSLLVVSHYWQQQIFAGRALPPPVKETDADVAEFVIATRGGIGYVSDDFPLPKGVKLVAILR